MKRIAWLTDIHLNFLLAQQVNDFLRSVAEARPDAVLIGGDIGEAQNVCDYLQWIDGWVATKVYFVLGNHDYYYGSIAEVRRRVAKLCSRAAATAFLDVRGSGSR